MEAESIFQYVLLFFKLKTLFSIFNEYWKYSLAKILVLDAMLTLIPTIPGKFFQGCKEKTSFLDGEVQKDTEDRTARDGVENSWETTPCPWKQINYLVDQISAD